MTNNENSYIVVGCMVWNKRIFDEKICKISIPQCGI